MAFWIILWKIIKVKLALNRLKRVKINAYRATRNLPPVYPCYIQIFHWIGRFFKFIFFHICCFCLTFRFKPGRPSLWDLLFTDGTLPNKVVKSIVGLIIGIILTNLWIIFTVHQLNFDPIKTTWISMGVGSVLVFGLAFSESMRCYCFLVFPQFFTKKGRIAMLCYCLTLALSGPAKNTTMNMEILTESLVCGQDMALNATRDLRELIQSPRAALGKVFQGIKEAISEATTLIKGGLRTLIDIIKYVVNIVKSGFYYLQDIASFCNEEYGSLYDKCSNMFQEAHANCEAELDFLPWNLNSAICSPVMLAEKLCYVSKAAEVLCWLPALIKDTILNPVLEFFEKIWDKIKQALFDIDIKANYKFEHKIHSTKSFRDIAKGMHQDIMSRVEWMLEYIDIVNLLVSLFMFVAFYKAYNYRRKFLKLDRHDNIYITKTMVEIDIQRRKVGKESAFPIKYRESGVYIQSSSLILTEKEKQMLKRELAIVSISIIKILSYVVIDYVFYQFLMLLRKHGGIVIDTRKIIGFEVKVKGEGFLADMYRFMLKALAPIGELMPVFDTTPCLPAPSIPNYARYYLIFFILFLVILATVSEPYGLRLRHIICEIYYPERKIPRARWLYVHILNTRDNFAEFAASYLKAMVTKTNRDNYHISCLDRLSRTVPGLRKLLYLLGYRKKKCFLCGKSGDEDDRENFNDCLKCFSVYCTECFEELGNVCVVCNSPIEYDELSGDESGSPSDMEEEKEYTKLINITIKRRVADSAAPELKNMGKLADTSQGSEEATSDDVDSDTPLLNEESDASSSLDSDEIIGDSESNPKLVKEKPVSSSSKSQDTSESETISTARSIDKQISSGSGSEESDHKLDQLSPNKSSTKSGESDFRSDDFSEKYSKTSSSAESIEESVISKESSSSSSKSSHKTTFTKQRDSQLRSSTTTKTISTTSSSVTSSSEYSLSETTDFAPEINSEDDESESDDEKMSLLSKRPAKRKESFLEKFTNIFKPKKTIGEKMHAPKQTERSTKYENFRKKLSRGSYSEATPESESSSTISILDSTMVEDSTGYASSSTSFDSLPRIHGSTNEKQKQLPKGFTPQRQKTHFNYLVPASTLYREQPKIDKTILPDVNVNNELKEQKMKLKTIQPKNIPTAYKPIFPSGGTNPTYETYNQFKTVIDELENTFNQLSMKPSDSGELKSVELEPSEDLFQPNDLLNLDGLDSQDELGNFHCHHHQPEDESTYEKFSDVISELTANFDENSVRDFDDEVENEISEPGAGTHKSNSSKSNSTASKSEEEQSDQGEPSKSSSSSDSENLPSKVSSSSSTSH